MANAVNECLRMGIPILPPDVNRSGVEFTLDRTADEQEGIRFGLSAIKNLGESAVGPIVDERTGKGPFKGLADFVRRVDLRGLNRRSLESLIKAGAFDSLGRRGPIFNATAAILSQSQMEARIRQTGQTSLFGGVSQQAEESLITFDLSGPDTETFEKVAWEKELLGVAITSNPLQKLLSDVPTGVISSLDQMNTDMEGNKITILGQLSSAQQRLTRDQRPFLNASIELLGGSVEVIAWPGVLERTQSLWKEGSLLEVEGKVVVRGEDVSIYCSNVHEYDPDKKTRPSTNVPAKSRRPAASKPVSGSNGSSLST